MRGRETPGLSRRKIVRHTTLVIGAAISGTDVLRFPGFPQIIDGSVDRQL